MRYDGAYKTYKLYSITEQDVTVSGGSGASRYVNNTVLVFLPDIEKPEIGTELLATDSMKSARKFIDDISKKPMKEVMEEAVLKSKEQEEQRRQKDQELINEEERRRREKERYAEEYERK